MKGFHLTFMNQFFQFGLITGICLALNLIALGSCLAQCFAAPKSAETILFTVGASLIAAGQVGFAKRRALAQRSRAEVSAVEDFSEEIEIQPSPLA